MQRKWDEGSRISDRIELYHQFQAVDVVRGKQRREISSRSKAEKYMFVRSVASDAVADRSASVMVDLGAGSAG